jgi:hypothetical protein
MECHLHNAHGELYMLEMAVVAAAPVVYRIRLWLRSRRAAR